MKLFTWIWDWIMSWFKKPPAIKPEPLYENYYPLNTPKDILEETEGNVKLEQVEEMTPDGKVIMKYNKEDNLFLYWSDKPIMYRFLEAVARKYVILYDCKDIYVNMYKELIKSLQENETMVNGPYVQFKSYNIHNRVKPKLVRERSNHYKYMGKLEMTKIKMPFKPINFLEYKNKNG
jgi:hypothetical protein